MSATHFLCLCGRRWPQPGRVVCCGRVHEICGDCACLETCVAKPRAGDLACNCFEERKVGQMSLVLAIPVERSVRRGCG